LLGLARFFFDFVLLCGLRLRLPAHLSKVEESRVRRLLPYG
jgi:hypothetical protein